MRKAAPVLALAGLMLAACDFSTKGERIPAYSEPARALLILDIQKDFTAPGARMPVQPQLAESMIANLNSYSARFRESGGLVIYVRNVFRKADVANLFRNFAAVEGSPGIAFDDRLRLVSDRVFDKSSPDAFSNRELADFLAAHRVTEVSVAGVFADQCVYWTGRGALNRGYRVRYLADAVAAKSAGHVDRAAGSLARHGASVATTKE
jgi:nicotinamidase-related amidase